MKRVEMDAIIKRTQEQGVTLLEMIVALLIFSIIILCVSRLYYFANSSITHGINIEQLQHQAQNTRNQLVRDVEQAALYQTGSAIMITTDNGITADDGYGVIIITKNEIATLQVWYRLTTWQDGVLQRFSGPYSGTYGQTNDSETYYYPTSWTTLLTGVTWTQPSSPPAPFTVTTLDDNGSILSHPALTIATLVVQVEHPVEPGTRPDAIVVPITTLNMRGNAVLQGGK